MLYFALAIIPCTNRIYLYSAHDRVNVLFAGVACLHFVVAMLTVAFSPTIYRSVSLEKTYRFENYEQVA